MHYLLKTIGAPNCPACLILLRASLGVPSPKLFSCPSTCCLPVSNRALDLSDCLAPQLCLTPGSRAVSTGVDQKKLNSMPTYSCQILYQRCFVALTLVQIAAETQEVASGGIMGRTLCKVLLPSQSVVSLGYCWLYFSGLQQCVGISRPITRLH
jgi:hypothetical protein